MFYNGHNFDEVIEAHNNWVIKGYPRDEIENRAVFSGKRCNELNFSGLDLSRANFSEANLCHAMFDNCQLARANFQDADLTGCFFRGARLFMVNFQGATLINAQFANAYLRGTILCDASLCGADFKGAIILDAVLNGANLVSATNLPSLPMIPPETGSFIGWKKCIVRPVTINDDDDTVLAIVKLRIPEDAMRSSATGRKCRCSKAEVVEITNTSGEPISENLVAFSQFDPEFQYRVGSMVVPSNGFDEDRWNECSTGIHFFMTRDEAVKYVW